MAVENPADAGENPADAVEALRSDAIDEAGVASLSRVLATPSHLHVMGIGGTGMSALATMLLELGHTVSGSDTSESAAVGRLRAVGASIVVGAPEHTAEALDTTPISAAVMSTAIPLDHPELSRLLAAGVTVHRRAALLRALSALVPTVAVSGTHGKTTSSAMLATTLSGCGIPISYLIGSDVPALGSASRWRREAEWLVVEADESDRSHLALRRSAAMVTNVEAEHLDRYGSLGAVVDGFADFVSETDGPVVMCVDDPGAALIASQVERSGRRVRRYGRSAAADVRLVDSAPTDPASVVIDGRSVPLELAVPGAHNRLNATGVLALAHELGVDLADAARAISAFTGTHRRFESRGRLLGARLYDDYAHHPTEVTATLATARSLGGRVVAVFQPHLFSRTAANADGFGRALAAADVAVVADVFAAREAPVEGVTGQLVADAAVAHGAGHVTYVPSRPALAETVLGIIDVGDVVVTIGAGDVTRLADEMTELTAADAPPR